MQNYKWLDNSYWEELNDVQLGTDSEPMITNILDENVEVQKIEVQKGIKLQPLKNHWQQYNPTHDAHSRVMIISTPSTFQTNTVIQLTVSPDLSWNFTEQSKIPDQWQNTLMYTRPGFTTPTSWHFATTSRIYSQ